MESSPWVQSRPMHLLAALEPDSEVALTYTLRTRVKRPAVGRELDKVPLSAWSFNHTQTFPVLNPILYATARPPVK